MARRNERRRNQKSLQHPPSPRSIRDWSRKPSPGFKGSAARALYFFRHAGNADVRAGNLAGGGPLTGAAAVRPLQAGRARSGERARWTGRSRGRRFTRRCRFPRQVGREPRQRIGRLRPARIERRRPLEVGDGGVAVAELLQDQPAQAQRLRRILVVGRGLAGVGQRLVEAAGEVMRLRAVVVGEGKARRQRDRLVVVLRRSGRTGRGRARRCRGCRK